eukprot:2022780-Prymnesium_polylepis.1
MRGECRVSAGRASWGGASHGVCLVPLRPLRAVRRRPSQAGAASQASPALLAAVLATAAVVMPHVHRRADRPRAVLVPSQPMRALD